MIELTKMNGRPVTVNAEAILTVEETPDTVVTLNTGIKLLVKESSEEIRNLVISYKKEVFKGIL